MIYRAKKYDHEVQIDIIKKNKYEPSI